MKPGRHGLGGPTHLPEVGTWVKSKLSMPLELKGGGRCVCGGVTLFLICGFCSSYFSVHGCVTICI